MIRPELREGRGCAANSKHNRNWLFYFCKLRYSGFVAVEANLKVTFYFHPSEKRQVKGNMSAADENKSNLISDAYDIWSKDYDDSVNPTRDLDTRAFGSQGFDLRDKAVVEVGCGTGRHTEALMIKFGDEIKSYTAFDLSQVSLRLFLSFPALTGFVSRACLKRPRKD